MSVLLPNRARPRIAFGQDEAIFCSLQQNDSCWTVDEESTLRSKGLGVGIMVSVFVSRELGFGVKILDGSLLDINKLREGQKCTD